MTFKFTNKGIGKGDFFEYILSYSFDLGTM